MNAVFFCKVGINMMQLKDANLGGYCRFIRSGLIIKSVSRA